MDLEIQSRNVERDPAWQELVEKQAERLSERYPELLRLHVTVGHGRHHRAGAEVVSLVANVEGATMRAEKQEAELTGAVRAAFRALTVALERNHRQRRAAPKPSGARPRGSVKSIFRDGGYGFIHFEPGRDVYFHRGSLQALRFEDLQPGHPVEFEVEEGAKGLQASRVYPAGARG